MTSRPQDPNHDSAKTPAALLLLLLDRTGAVVNWTDAAVQATGYTPEELRGTLFNRLFALAARAGIKQPLDDAANHGRSSSRGWIRRKDGSRVEALLSIERIRAEPGDTARFAATLVDLAAQQQTETALAESEQRFRMLVHGVADYAIFMLDPRGHITNWNFGGERIKGYAAEEIVGQHFSRFYTPEERAKGTPARALEIARREGRYEGEGWRVRKDGTRFWANVVIDRILDPEGRLVGFAKITRDVSEKKLVEDELERARAALAQSQKMEAVGQLTGGIAHDFNNLLTVITNALDLLARPARDQAQRRRIIESAQRAADRGARLTQQLLAFSRRQSLRPQIQDANSLIRGFEAVLRRACPEPIEFEVRLAPDALAASIDPRQFETALTNLVVNARDAMPNGGKLVIATSRKTVGETEARSMSDTEPGEYVSVSVGDNGEGMGPEVRARAFEPFFTTKEVGKGSGLGLSQVYGFVTQSGGHVRIDSKPRSGTTVSLFLPAARPGAATAARADEADIERKPAMGRVLVVEDDPEVLDVAVEMLRSFGYEVLTAPDGPSALSVLRRDADIDVLFTDIVMPRGMNGVELAREACRLRSDLRVLLVSGYSASVLASDHRAEDNGEFVFLKKPYRGAELAEKLRALQSQ